MPLTIVATAGDASANSFVTETEQIAYVAARLNASAWTTVTGSTCTETEKAAMIEATRELSALRWQGRRTSATQALAWPRYPVSNPDAALDVPYDSTVIPQRVKDATCELAFQFLKAGTADLAVIDPSEQVAAEQVDVLSTTYVDISQRAKGLKRFTRLWGWIAPLLESTGASYAVSRG